MAWDIQLRDDSGTVHYSLWMGHERYYVLPDGRHCEAPQRIAWCEKCRQFEIAQEVPALSEIDSCLEAIPNGPEALRNWFVAEGEPVPQYYLTQKWEWFSEMLLDRYRLMRDWRVLRHSPPRCFECYSFDVDLLPKNSSETIDRINGQHLHIGCNSHSHLINRWSFDVEGLPLKARISKSQSAGTEGGLRDTSVP